MKPDQDWTQGFDNFEQYIQRIFSGAEWITVGKPERVGVALRYSFRSTSSESHELIMDLLPGPKTSFGQAIIEKTAGRWGYLYGTEIVNVAPIGEKQPQLEIRGPAQAFYEYIYGALAPREVSGIAIGPENPQERLGELRRTGYRLGEHAVAGGIQMIHPTLFSFQQQRMLAETIAVQVPGRSSYQAVAEIIARNSRLATLNVKGKPVPDDILTGDYLWSRAMGFGIAPKGQPDLFRLIKLGNVFWDEAATKLMTEFISGTLGSDEFSAINNAYKRYPMLMRQSIGLLELRSDNAPDAQFFNEHGMPAVGEVNMPTPKATLKPGATIWNLQQAEPQFITSMNEAERAGYRWLNISVEGQRPAAIVRPYSAVIPTPFSGAGFEWKPIINEGQGYTVVAGAYPKDIRVSHPDLPPMDWQNVSIQTGIFRERWVGEGDQRRLEYEKLRGLEGAPLSPGQEYIVGLMTTHGIGGVENQLTPLRVTTPEANAMTISSFTLQLPRAINRMTGYGVDPVSLEYEQMMREQPQNVQSTDVIKEQILRANPHLRVEQVAMGQPVIIATANELVGIKETGVGGYKQEISFVPRPVGAMGVPGEAVPSVVLGIGNQTARHDIYFVTGEGKMPINQFIYGTFGSLPNTNQIKMLQLMNFEAPGLGDEIIRDVTKYWTSLPAEMQRQPQKGIPLELLAETYSRATKTNNVSVNFFFDRLQRLVESKVNPVESMLRFNYYYQKEPIWWAVTRVSASERQLLEQQMEEMRVRTGGTSDASQYVRFTPQGNLQLMEVKARGYWQTTASTLSAEYLTKTPRLGIEETMALNDYDKEIAKLLNMSLEQHPSYTGAEPPHVRGWRLLSNILSFNNLDMRPRPEFTGELGGQTPYKIMNVTDLPSEALDLILSEGRDLGKMKNAAFERFYELTKGAEVLRNPVSGELFPLLKPISEVSHFNYGPEYGFEQGAISGIMRTWGAALEEFVQGASYSQGGRLQDWGRRLSGMVESKEINKLLYSRFPADAFGGRYNLLTGTDLWVSEMPQGVYERIVRGIGKRIGLGGEQLTSWESKISAQVEEQGGLPTLYFRSPNTQLQYNVSTMLAMTPGMIKRKYGFYIPSDTIVQGKFKVSVRPGSPYATGTAGGVGIISAEQFGDWDADQITAVVESLMTTGMFTVDGYLMSREIKDRLPKTPQEAISNFLVGIQKAGGDKASELNVLQSMFKDIVDANDPTKAGSKYIGAIPVTDLIDIVGQRRKVARGGMGIAFNLRRFMEATMSTLPFTTGEVSAARLGQLPGYQQYLDYLKEWVQNTGEISELETMFNTTMFAYDPTNRKISLIGKQGQQAPFSQFWNETPYQTEEGVGSGAQSWYWFGRRLGEAVGKSRWTAEAQAFALANSPEQVEQIAERIKALGSVSAALFETGSGLPAIEGWDIRKSPIGKALIIAGYARTAGLFGKPPKEVETLTSGGRRSFQIANMIKTSPVDLFGRGEDVAYGTYMDQPEFRSVIALYKAVVGKYGPLSPPEALDIYTMAQQRIGVGLGATLQQQLILSTLAITPEQADIIGRAVLTAARKSELKGQYISEVIKNKLELRGSMMGGLAFDDPKVVSVYQGNTIYEGKRMSTVEAIHRKTLKELVLVNVFGLDPNKPEDKLIIDDVKETDAMQEIRMEEGKVFEAGAIPQIKKDWGMVSGEVFTGMKQGFGISLTKLAGATSNEEFIQYARDMKAEGVNLTATGTPDILGTRMIGGEERLFLGEIKRYSQSVLSPYASIQASTYAVMMKAAKAGASIKRFADVIEPMLYSSAEWSGEGGMFGPKLMVEYKAWIDGGRKKGTEGPTLKAARKETERIAGKWRGLINEGKFDVEQISPMMESERTGHASPIVENGKIIFMKGGQIEPEAWVEDIFAAIKTGIETQRNPRLLEELIDTIVQYATVGANAPGMLGKLADIISTIGVPKGHVRSFVGVRGGAARITGGGGGMEGGIPGGGTTVADWEDNFFKRLEQVFTKGLEVVVSHIGGGRTSTGAVETAEAGLAALHAITPEQIKWAAGFQEKVTSFAVAAGHPEWTGGTALGEFAKARPAEFAATIAQRSIPSQLYRLNQAVAAAQQGSVLYGLGVSETARQELSGAIMGGGGVSGAPALVQPGTPGHAMFWGMQAEKLAREEEIGKTRVGKGGKTVYEETAEGLKTMQEAVQKVTTGLTELSEKGLSPQAKAAAQAKVSEGYAQIRAGEVQYNAAQAMGVLTAAAQPGGPQLTADQVQQYGGMVQEGMGGPVARGKANVNKFFRGLIGGWGLMYLSHLASFPMQQLAYGEQQAQQYETAISQYAGGIMGTAAGEPFSAAAYKQLQSYIQYQGTAKAGMDALSAAMPPWMRDIKGVGLGAAAGAAGALYASGVAAQAGAGMAGVSAFFSSVVGPAAVLGAVGVVAAQTYGSYSNPQAAAISGASSLGKGDTLSAYLKTTLATDIWGVKVGDPGRVGAAGGQTMTYKPSAYVLKGILPDQLAAIMNNYNKKMEGGMSAVQAQAETGMPSEALYMSVSALATQAIYSGLDPTLLSQNALKLSAAGMSYNALIPMTKTEMVGVSLDTLAAQAVQATRLPFTEQNVMQYEQLFGTMNLNRYQQVTMTQAYQGIANMPYAQAQAYGYLDAVSLARGEERQLPILSRAVGNPPAQRTTAVTVPTVTYVPGVGGIPTGLVTENVPIPNPHLRRYYHVEMDAAAQKARRDIAQKTAQMDALERSANYPLFQQQSQVVSNAQAAGIDVSNMVQIKADSSPSELYQALTQMSNWTRQTDIVQASAAMNLPETMRGTLQSMAASTIGGAQAQQIVNQVSAVAPYMASQQQVDAFAGTMIGITQQYGAQGLSQAQKFMNTDPITMARVAMAGGMPAQQQSFYNLMANVDIGVGGNITGMAWGTTGLQRGGSSAFAQGAQIFGTSMFKGMTGGVLSEAQARQMMAGGAQLTDAARAAIYGIAGPNGQIYGGSWGVQLLQNKQTYEYQIAQLGVQQQGQAMTMAFQTGIGLGNYNPTDPRTGQAFNIQGTGGFWGIEDRQRNLSYAQAQWGFQSQQQSLQMQSRQFYENMGLQQQQMNMQRQWTKEDWSYQGQVRNMQWGWQQQDFGENVRFMTGRERRLAERQMGRETTLHDMESEQIEKTKNRQKEMWKLEDERFALQKRQYEEQKDFQEQQLAKQKEFYEMGFDLQKQQTDLSRAYFIEQQKLQTASIAVQATYAEQMKDDNDKLMLIGQQQALNTGLMKVATDDEVTMINTLITGLNWVNDHLPELFKSGTTIPNYVPSTEAPIPDQGPVGQGHKTGLSNYIVPPGYPRDSAFIRVSSGERVDITPLGGAHGFADPWGTTVIPSNRNRSGSIQRIVVPIYIGGDLLEEKVIEIVDGQVRQ
jgi:hypothetical protein